MRFFFHIENSFGFAKDEEGRELPDLDGARDEAVRAAGDILIDEVRQGHDETCIKVHVENTDARLMTVVVNARVEAGGA